MTPEQKERLRYNAAAMLAFADGKPIQGWSTSDQRFYDTTEPTWDCEAYRYRPKPEPATRPWSKPEDVPGPVCWIRRLDPTDGSVSLEAMVIAVSTQAITWFTNDYREYRWEHFNRVKWEYSTDRKTWRKCEVTLP